MMAKFSFMLFNQLMQTAAFAYTENKQAKQMLKLYCKNSPSSMQHNFSRIFGWLIFINNILLFVVNME